MTQGFRTGKLTVNGDTTRRKNGCTVWHCTSDCGGTTDLGTRALQRRRIRDCGCETKVKPGQRDLTGLRFGRLVCLEPISERDNQGGTQWLCNSIITQFLLASEGGRLLILPNKNFP